MNKTQKFIMGVVGLVAILALIFSLAKVGGNSQPSITEGQVRAIVAETFGASGTRFPNGLSADSTSPTAGQLRGSTLTLTGASTFGGTATFTSTNTATSTQKMGCIQFSATSTATIGHFEYNTQSTTTTNGASSGVVAWKYGACPV